MLAKNVNDDAYFLNKRGAYEFLASKLAPTKGDLTCLIMVCQVCRRTHTLTNTVAAINQATAATASDASNRSRSTITYNVAKYTKYGMIDHIPNRIVVFKSATVRPLPTM